MNRYFKTLCALLVASLATGAVASMLQTQLTLASLLQMGAPVSASLRLGMTLQDLARFGAVMAGISGAGLLIALLAASVVLRWAGARARSMIVMLAAVLSMALVFWLMRSVIPMPALSGTRTGVGFLLMSLSGAAGGLLLARLTRAQPPKRLVLLAVVCALVPAAAFVLMRPAAEVLPPLADPHSYRLETLVKGLDRPWSVAALPDGRLLISEMKGKLLVRQADGALGEIALPAFPAALHYKGLAGFMEVVADPNFARNGMLYLTMAYGDRSANGTRLVRARLVGNALVEPHVLFSSTLKPSLGNNGGRLAFLPDGTLVLSVGDGSARREEAQNPTNTLGKVVRLDRDGHPPADNPLRGTPDADPYLYSLGHRNAQGIAFDPLTGELLLSEHGARGGDEINRVIAGGNYGWPVVTDGIDYPFAQVTPFRQLAGYEDPLLVWTPSIAPSGLAVYRGALFEAWQGDLLVPALRERSLRRVIRQDGRIVGQQRLLSELDERIRDVKVAPDGAVLVLTDGVDARLLRLTPALR